MFMICLKNASFCRKKRFFEKCLLGGLMLVIYLPLGGLMFMIYLSSRSAEINVFLMIFMIYLLLVGWALWSTTFLEKNVFPSLFVLFFFVSCFFCFNFSSFSSSSSSCCVALLLSFFVYLPSFVSSSWKQKKEDKERKKEGITRNNKTRKRKIIMNEEQEK